MTKLLPIEFVKIGAPTDKFSSVGVDLATLLVSSNLATTKTDARRQIKAGAVRLNDQVVKDPFARLTLKDNQVLVLERENPSSFTR